MVSSRAAVSLSLAAAGAAVAVSDLTDGQFQIDVFAAGELAPAPGVVDAVQNGTVEMGHSASYYYVGKDPALLSTPA